MRTLSGKTALVTGASAGIGREIARVLGREAATLVLVARRRDRLEALAAELTSNRAELRVIIHAVDLTNRAATEAMLDELERAGERIDVFVNNAGFGLRFPFHQADWSRIQGMLELNVVSATFLLKRLVPPMVARGSGAILNVGSTAGIVPQPGSAVYGATKAYLNHLSEALRGELAGTGVTMTALLPGPVETEFQEVAGSEVPTPIPRLFFVDAVAVAEQAVRAMVRGRARVIPGASTRAATLSIEALPKVVIRPVLSRIGQRIRRRF